MHQNKRASVARGALGGSLLLALGVWASPVLAQAPGAAAPASSPSAAPGGAAKPAAAAAAPATAGAKPKRKLPMRACPAKVPEELNPPPDVTLEMVLPATGVQSYACAIEKPGDAPDWAPKGPHAMLGEPNNLMGIHFGGPSWQAMDGSLVKGTKISSAGAPDKSAIVWLLLSGAPSGEGIFGKTTHIQRLDTVGGRPPQGGCDASHLDTRVLVPYRSNYYFYREAAPGETVRQCKGAPSKTAAGDKSPGDKTSADKGNGKPGKAGDKPKAEKPAGEKPALKPAVEKTAKSSSEKAAAEKSTSEKSSSERSTTEKSGAKPE